MKSCTKKKITAKKLDNKSGEGRRGITQHSAKDTKGRQGGKSRATSLHSTLNTLSADTEGSERDNGKEEKEENKERERLHRKRRRSYVHASPCNPSRQSGKKSGGGSRLSKSICRVRGANLYLGRSHRRSSYRKSAGGMRIGCYVASEAGVD